ncbi:MAG: hypothetical protein IKE70_02980 [Bacilli bacterium]|nr:hypothetical protein [Bacilli bacterium]
MKKCNYCGRYYKQGNTCPACNSIDFEEIRNPGSIRIDKPPKDGYTINMSDIKNEIIIGKTLKYIGLFFIIGSLSIAILVLIGIIILSILTPQQTNIKELIETIQIGILFSFFIPSPLLGLLLYYLGNKSLKDSLDTKEKVNDLRKNGILIKNLKYKAKKDLITVYFENDKGMQIPLQCKKVHVPLIRPDSCDILFKKDNPRIYYIDFDIY